MLLPPILLALSILTIHSTGITAQDNHLQLLLLHNNDMHARFEETSETSGTCKKTSNSKCFGGFARTAHEIRYYRKLAEEGKGRKVLYLNAGDTYTGTSWFSVHKWKICAEFMNILRPDVMSLGNHEFDMGVPGLAPFINNASFPLVAANLNFTLEPSLEKVKKSVVLEIDGHKIGIIGHLIKDTQIISSTGNVIFNDEVEAVRIEAERLNKEEGVKIFIALGHSGYAIDQKIAAEVPLIDVVIGGHTNTFLWNGQKPSIEVPEDLYPKVITQKSGKKVPVVQAYAYTKYLGRLNVTFDGNGDLVEFAGQPLLLDSSIPQDQDVLEVLDKYRPEIEELNNKVIGSTKVVLEALTDNNKCRQVECNMGNMVTDALVFYLSLQSTGNGWTDYPIAIFNGGSLRTNIAQGNITKAELLSAVPFESQIMGISMNGSDLIKTLELGIRSNGETSKGEFLQVSGLHVTYDRSKPPMQRVVKVLARCGDCRVPVYSEVKPDQIYKIIVTGFLSGGGDGHYVIKANSKNPFIQDLVDSDVVEYYLKRRSPVYPEEQGRIEFVKTTDKETSSSGQRISNSVFFFFVISIHTVLSIYSY